MISYQKIHDLDIYFFQQYRKIIYLSLSSFFALLILFSAIISLSYKKVYYLDKDNRKLIVERKLIKNIKPYTKIQNLLRKYLDGSIEYRARLPFMGVTQLININHDQNTRTLVLNWDSYFTVVMEDEYFDMDVYYLLKTIKKNTNINKVYFLIKSHQIPIFWKASNLSSGILLKEID
ncbi:MAG: GerMN domain-containing protein [Brevinema sp.]